MLLFGFVKFYGARNRHSLGGRNESLVFHADSSGNFSSSERLALITVLRDSPHRLFQSLLKRQFRSSKAVCKHGRTYTNALSKSGKRNLLTSHFNRDRRPFVSALGFTVRPSTIFGLVVSKRIDSVERTIFWALTHIFSKVRKGFPPPANGDAGAPIVSEARNIWVAAALDHAVPAYVGPAAVAAMLSAGFKGHASAALRALRLDVTERYPLASSAVAIAKGKPSPAPFVYSPHLDLTNKKSTNFLIQIFNWFAFFHWSENGFTFGLI